MAVSLDHLHARSIYDPRDADFASAAYPFVPLTAPGMPSVGVDFVSLASALGDDVTVDALKNKKDVVTGQILTNLYRQALYDPNFNMRVSFKNNIDGVIVTFLPGHIWGARHGAVSVYGPLRKARVMVVGKMPGKYELERKKTIAGPGMVLLETQLAECGFTPAVYESWYTTFCCKFTAVEKEITAIPAAWLKDCAVLLEQEIRLVQPDYILCLGAEATKAVMKINGNVSNLSGRAVKLETVDAAGNPREVQVMSIMHPAYVARKPDAIEDFKAQINRFKALLENKIYVEEEVDHADIYTEEALVSTVDAMVADKTLNANVIAVDCEWHGDHPTEPGAYLRTVQISNKDRWARTIVLRHEGGAVAFKPGLDVVRRELTRLLKSTPARNVRVGGHFLRADLPWLLDFGVDLRPEYEPAKDPDDREHGGWDTSLMYHAVNECARYGLDECVMRFTSAPTYWDALDEWKKRYKAENKLKAGEVGGYGNCPAYILHPYGSYDADVTRRIMLRFYGTNGRDGLIAKDAHNIDCWLPYWTAHSASTAFLEMELTGMVIDRDRADELTTIFMETQEKLLAEVRDALNWPEFNPKSQPQLAVALFGREYGGRYTNPPTVPEDAALLDLTPVKTTGKRPILWEELGWRGVDAATATPSTDKESLGILGHGNATAAKIRDYKFVSQVLQSTLRKPAADETGEFELDENGNYVYDKGLVGCAHSDGRVRTHFFQTKETGRASSSRPPLQNLSSRREDDYKRIIGKDRYLHPVRSILRVPEGCVGMETDLTGAELAVLAWLAQDKNMIEHVRRNLLPEDDPDHYDIHSQQAVKTFRLKGVTPTKKGMEAAGVKGLRVAAKNVNFGIPYGRGAEALARQCKEEGHDVTADQCQAMIEAYFSSYPKTKEFLAECRARSQEPGFLVGPYGRMRRFVPSADRAVRGEQERQAQNFPIQGGVADAVSIALSNFYQYREEHTDIDYKIAMQIHDAIMLIVPIEHAERVYKEVIPKCMVDDVPFWPRRLDGVLIPNAGPYHFGADRDVFVHWGEKLKPQQAKELGLSWLFPD